MDYLVIRGTKKLQGEVEISGAKNAALPLFAAALLCEKTEFTNVPALRDIDSMIELLSYLGCEIEQTIASNKNGKTDNKCVIKTNKNIKHDAPYDLVRKMRASVLVLGPLLARFGQARVSLPGGCAIGVRPIDMHLYALSQMGAEITVESGYIEATIKGKLKGCTVDFEIVSVTATENAIMAAVLAEGEVIIKNAACEPEIVDLAKFLNNCGAKIYGAGTNIITIQGVERLDNTSHRVIGDRIEAGTYLIAAAITKGEVLVKDIEPEHLGAVFSTFQEIGINIEISNQGIFVSNNGNLKNIDISTKPYPGFPTDMQAQLMALLCLINGESIIEENIFEGRFMHVPELARMGAKIKVIDHHKALVKGVDFLSGAEVMATDLRASAALVLAGLAAKKTTTIRRIYHLKRGYSNLVEKLKLLGADLN